MRTQFFYSGLVLTLLFMECTTHEITHDISSIKEEGEWVNIKNAPLTYNYVLRGDRIYGVGFNTPLDRIDWDLFWDEFLMPRSTLVITEKFGRTTSKWESRDSSDFSLKHVDVETFEVNVNSSKNYGEMQYAKDKRYVYYPIHISIEDYHNYYDISFEGDIRIPGADPKTFKYLGKGYAVDKNNMYYEGKKIKWNDYIISALQEDDCPQFLPTDYGMANDEK